MTRPRARTSYALWLILAGCGFNSNGLATSTNGSGMLDSGSDTSGGASTTQSSTTAMTSASDGTTMPSSTTVSDETGPATTMPGTTENPTEPTTSDATLDPTDTASSSSAGTVSAGTSSDGGGSSSDGGDPGEPYYGMCSGEGDCGTGQCTGFYMGDLIASVCYVPCDNGTCPAGSSGTAVGTCNVNGDCVLDCAGGATCPDDMQCYEVDFGGGTSGFRCAWPV